MGGSSSTRRVVVEDAGGDDVVTVSEAVVRRLKGQPDLEYKGGDRPSVPPPKYREPDQASKLMRNKEVEDYYLQKLKELQERNASLQNITNEQFARAVKEVEQKFIKVTASPVCLDLQTKVLECYQANPDEILNCSAIVRAFTSCVDRARMKLELADVHDDDDGSLLRTGRKPNPMDLLRQPECKE